MTALQSAIAGGSVMYLVTAGRGDKILHVLGMDYGKADGGSGVGFGGGWGGQVTTWWHAWGAGHEDDCIGVLWEPN